MTTTTLNFQVASELVFLQPCRNPKLSEGIGLTNERAGPRETAPLATPIHWEWRRSLFSKASRRRTLLSLLLPFWITQSVVGQPLLLRRRSSSILSDTFFLNNRRSLISRKYECARSVSAMSFVSAQSNYTSFCAQPNRKAARPTSCIFVSCVCCCDTRGPRRSPALRGCYRDTPTGSERYPVDLLVAYHCSVMRVALARESGEVPVVKDPALRIHGKS